MAKTEASERIDHFERLNHATPNDAQGQQARFRKEMARILPLLPKNPN